MKERYTTNRKESKRNNVHRIGRSNLPTNNAKFSNRPNTSRLKSIMSKLGKHTITEHQLAKPKEKKSLVWSFEFIHEVLRSKKEYFSLLVLLHRERFRFHNRSQDNFDRIIVLKIYPFI